MKCAFNTARFPKTVPSKPIEIIIDEGINFMAKQSTSIKRSIL